MTVVEELEEYAMLEYSEVGEYWAALIKLFRCSLIDFNLKPKIQQAIANELKFVKESSVITETEKTYYQKVKKLEWF